MIQQFSRWLIYFLCISRLYPVPQTQYPIIKPLYTGSMDQGIREIYQQMETSLVTFVHSSNNECAEKRFILPPWYF